MESIIENILIQVLGITPSALTGTFFNDFVNFILLPTVVILIFLNSAADYFTNKKQYKAILSVTFLLVMIAEGFYAPFAMFVSNYIIIFLIISAVFFFGMRIFGARTQSSTLPKIEDMRKQRIDMRIIQDEVDFLYNELNRIKSEKNNKDLTESEKKEYLKQERKVRDQIKDKESELRRYKMMSDVR